MADSLSERFLFASATQKKSHSDWMKEKKKSFILKQEKNK